MSDISGLILQQQSTQIAISNLRLLIVTEFADDVKDICSSLKSAGIDFTYDVIALGASTWDISSKNYDAILYSYYLSFNCNYKSSGMLFEQLDWWYALPKPIPLILIADKLNEEIAVQLPQSGISNCILRHRLQELPNKLEYTLINLARKQQRENKHLKLIRRQQKQLEQLEAEKLTWEAGEAQQQQHISHLIHELRRPTSSIIGFARMLKDELYGSLNPKQMQYVSALLITGQYLLDLVNNYLDLAKIEAEKETINLEKLTVADVCQASLFMVHQKAKEKNIELIFNIADNIDFCFADRVRLKQILVNLLYNAVKFTSKGSVTLDVKIKDNMLNFDIIDTGIGISPENIKKLFQPFQQINHHPEGTGLGLALSRKLAQLHGGDIMVTSEVDKGSCFTLYIPHDQKIPKKY